MLNVKHRLILITTFTVFITSISTFLLHQHIFKKVLYSKFENKINFIGRHLASSVAIGIILNNKKILSDIVSSMLNDPDVTGIVIEDKQGHILYKKGKLSSYVINFPVLLSVPKKDVLYSESVKQPLGFIKIGYTTHNLHMLLKDLFLHSFILAIIIAVVIGCVIYIFSIRSFVRPFQELLSAVSNVSKGNFNFSVSGEGLPETRQLALAFMQMITSLKNSQKLLKQTYEEMIYQKSLAEIGKMSFIVAHEVKNPLGIIKGSLAILKKREVDEKVKWQMVNYIEEEVERLDAFIREFLFLSRPKRPELKCINLKEFMYRLQEKIIMEFAYADININMYKNIEYYTDPFLLEKILFNLIKNAYEAKATKVIICVDSNESNLVIKVKDNGLGVAEKEKIFEPFFTTKEKGTGLGLVFVSQAVYALKGKIEVKENKPHGTIFILYFPLNMLKNFPQQNTEIMSTE